MHPFEALAEPARRRILDILASGEHTAGQLAAVVGGEFRISRTAVSKHLRILRDAGLVDVRAEERFRWYRMTPDAIATLAAPLKDLRRKWRMRSGWDADARALVDPLAHPVALYDAVPDSATPHDAAPYDAAPHDAAPYDAAPHASVPRKGPGRPYRRGRRGRQQEPPIAADPEADLYPTF